MLVLSAHQGQAGDLKLEETGEIAITGQVKGDEIGGKYTAIGKTPGGEALFPKEVGRFEGLGVRPRGGNL